MQLTPVNLIFQGFAVTAQNRIHFENFILKSIDLTGYYNTPLNSMKTLIFINPKDLRLTDKI